MTLPNRIKIVGVTLVILVGCIPIAFIITIITAPFWEWIEEKFKVESYGHSGPAEWCYYATYILIILTCTVVWYYVYHKKH